MGRGRKFIAASYLFRVPIAPAFDRNAKPSKQAGCWKSLGVAYITSTHKAGDRCRKCGLGMAK